MPKYWVKNYFAHGRTQAAWANFYKLHCLAKTTLNVKEKSLSNGDLQLWPMFNWIFNFMFVHDMVTLIFTRFKFVMTFITNFAVGRFFTIYT